MFYDFSVYTANKIYLRYVPSEPKIGKTGKPLKKAGRKLSKIKSISNYVKKSIFFEKLRFLQESYVDNWYKKDIIEDVPKTL